MSIEMANDIDKKDLKLSAFEYILYQLNNWYKEANNAEIKGNDISILKAMKLLFFVANVNTADDKEEYSDLLDIFDNFQAWRLGHVESDTYYAMKESKNIKIDRNGLIINCEEHIKEWANKNYKLAERIDDSIFALKKINFDLIKKEAFSLVDISHSYLSWIYYNQYLKEYTTIIPISEIRNEEKYYS